jgi:hypothetical protein
VNTAVKLAYDGPDWAPAVDPNGIQSIERDPCEIDEPRLRQLYAHWSEARGDQPWLRHMDLRPELCPLILPHLALIERRPNRKPSLYIRLTGEEIANRALGFAKGRFVEDLRPEWYRNHLVTSYRNAFDDGAAHFQLVRVVYSYNVVLYRRFILPITRFGYSPDLLLVATLRTRRLADFISAGRELN